MTITLHEPIQLPPPNPSAEHRREAAQMLRQAAQVMQKQGFIRQSFIEPLSGRVCMDGALMSVGLQTIVRHRLLHNNEIRFQFQDTALSGSPERCYASHIYDIAASALIDGLPSVCREHKTGWCPLIPRGLDRVKPDQLPFGLARIHHYNDYVCDGGDEAALILVTAAEKIEADL